MTRPAYRSLARRLVEAIEAGEIVAGTQLPTHRALAYQLGLSVHTVSRAYDELSRLGIISGEVGRGSFVTTGKSDGGLPWTRVAEDARVIDLSVVTPVTGPLHRERMAATLAALADDLDPQLMFSFHPHTTLRDHCEIALDWLAECGLEVDPEQVLPTNGCTAAMTVALMRVTKPGDLLVTEAMGHHTLCALSSALGLRITGLATDGEGILPEAFERACRAMPVQALFVMPSALGPTAAMMGIERRAALVEVARRHNVMIIENDAWGPLEPSRPPPVAALAPERTLYVTGLSKCLLPGLRVGWLVLPEDLVEGARARHLVTQWMATPLSVEIASRWLADGTGTALLAWQRATLAPRMRRARSALAALPHTSAQHGLHLWLPLPAAWADEAAFVAALRSRGIAVAAGSHFHIGDNGSMPGVRISVGSVEDEALDTGLSEIAGLAGARPEAAQAAH